VIVATQVRRRLGATRYTAARRIGGSRTRASPRSRSGGRPGLLTAVCRGRLGPSGGSLGSCDAGVGRRFRLVEAAVSVAF
jgi:hypothetical protein